jgi:hypothetical protein
MNDEGIRNLLLGIQECKIEPAFVKTSAGCECKKEDTLIPNS